ncbi:Transcription factor MYB83 [Bienertia sinuspersici]
MRKPTTDPAAKSNNPGNGGNPNHNNSISNSNSNSNSNNAMKLRKGLWSPEEDDKLINYMLTNGQGCWSDVARNAGLQRWSQIAARLPGRTDNEIKNFWNSTVKKRLKSGSTSSSPNASDSSLSTEARDRDGGMVGGGGFMTMQDPSSIMAMYVNNNSASPTSSSMVPLIHHHHGIMDHPFPNMVDMPDDGSNGGGYMDASSCISMASMHGMSHTNGDDNNNNNDDGMMCGSYGMLESHNYNYGILQGELSIPSLETISIEENTQVSEDIGFGRNTINNNTNNDNHFDNNNSNNHFTHHNNHHIISSTNNNNTPLNNSIASSIKKYDASTPGVETHWEGGGGGGGEVSRFGEWDFEELMKDVSSFPFIDYQIE